jgi:copper transport protein
MRTQWLYFTRAVVLLAALLAGGLGVMPVSAHALLLRSNPAANAMLASGPAQVELFFSEALEPSLSSVMVLDAAAQVVDQQDVRIDPVDPTRMTVSLRSLADGVYTVAWKAISATDGHLTSGSFPFAVGSGQAAALSSARPEQKQIPLSPLGVVIQWLEVAALAILAGGKPFQALIWRAAVKEGEVDHEPRNPDDPVGAGFKPAQDRRLKDASKNAGDRLRLPWAGLKPAPTLTDKSKTSDLPNPPAWKSLQILSLVGLFALLAADLLDQAGQSGRGGFATLLSVNAGQILLETRLGSIWLARLALALACAWLALSWPRPWKEWTAFGVTLALLFTLSLTSHAAAEPQALLPVLADWLHLAAVSLWIGGLAHFVPAVRQIRRADGARQTRLTSLMIVRFSALALTCVGVIGLTGVYAAVLRIGSLPALFNTLYGQALILKLILAALLLGLGALNLLVLSPRLKKERLLGQDNPALVQRFGRVIVAEVSLGMLVVLSASLLASLPPVVAAATSADQVHSLQADDLQETLDISPGRVGLNTFTLQILSNGQPVTLANEVDLRFSAIQQNVPPSEIQLVSQGNGVYVAKGSYLSLPGAWQIQTIVRRTNKFDAYANLNLSFQSPAASSAVSADPHITGGLLAIIGLAYGLLMFTLLRSTRLRVGLGGAPLAALVGLGIIFVTSPLPSNQGVVNPIPPNSASVSAGQALYTAHCAVCHGTGGKGDGPAGVAMNPHPADLTLHAVPGVHTDAQLFQWISQGYPGTQMPPFQSTLSATDRWNLVNFIRTLAPK